MLKFLLVLVIVGYILYKIGSVFFRAGVMTQRMRDEKNQFRAKKAPSGKSGKIKDGDYVDYEEVK